MPIPWPCCSSEQSNEKGGIPRVNRQNTSPLQEMMRKASRQFLGAATAVYPKFVHPYHITYRRDWNEEDFEDTEKAKSKRPKMEGQLLKYTNVMKGWQTRWFVLDPDSGFLEYFEKEEHKKQRPRGCVHLAVAVISPSDEDGQTFIVTAANGEVYKLKATDTRERQHWVDRLRSTAEYHTANIAQNPQLSRDGAGTPRRLDPSQKVKATSEESLQSLNRFFERKLPPPFIEVQEYLTEAQDFSQKLTEKVASLPYTGDSAYMTGLDKDLLILKATSAATIQCVQDCLNLLQNAQMYAIPTSNPNVSGGTSKKGAPSPTPSAGKPGDASGTAPSSPVSEKRPFPTCLQDLEAATNEPMSVIPPEEEKTDPVMSKEEDLGAVEEHKSVILHLLSQLKLGMDLTKVVLPTFILERRSLLEMFADCMAHPDVFLSITDLKSPEERMLMVLEWYLTSFHAGRQGSVAKKPYNPVIGETFHCSWLIPRKDDNKVILNSPKDEGLLGTKTVRLVYHAEQVSHHPPVSAFYFECPEKKVCMNGSIYTKSKFMGMSIGVVMVGKVTLRLLDHNEEYTFSLPSAYARSILTTPWVELGDKITMACEKNNMAANIVFHTKPFYGGKLHRVTAELKNTVTNAVICKVNGEWDDKFEFSYSEGTQKMIDVSKLTIWRKRVRPVDKQSEFESRRLWQHVTNALNLGDVNTATEHKRLLEERQREGERHRKQTGAKFPTKYFHEDGELWVYNHMLIGTGL